MLDHQEILIFGANDKEFAILSDVGCFIFHGTIEELAAELEPRVKRICVYGDDYTRLNQMIGVVVGSNEYSNAIRNSFRKVGVETEYVTIQPLDRFLPKYYDIQKLHLQIPDTRD